MKDWSQGSAFVHNLIGGTLVIAAQGRSVPYHKAHSTEIAGLDKIAGGDTRDVQTDEF